MAYKIYIEKQGTPYPNDIKNNDGSLESLPDISTKIKPIDRDKANSELEKGELVLDPETGALHKVLGKPHSKGGTPTLLKDNSFIFSNYKNLALNKEEKELFEFKSGGKFKLKNNTPAKILEKEIDLEHHNKMIDILNNEKKHLKETVNSAKLMMLKNLEKAGQVAFLQESKKGYQAPDFAQSTAPVYSKQTDDQINQSMQYMQMGGRKLTEEEIALAEQNLLNNTKGWNLRYKTGPKSYYDKPSSKPYNGPLAKPEDWLKFLATPKGQAFLANQNKFGFTKENIDAPLPRTPIPLIGPGTLDRLHSSPSASLTPKNLSFDFLKTGNSPGNPNGIVDPTNYNTKLTPWQKINIGIPFYKALNVKTQYPLRQHQESVIPQMENINVQPQLDANNQSYFNLAKLVGSSQAQLAYGNRIAANNQAIGNVQQANVATQNNQKIMAANSLNQDAAQNRAFDLKYYDQTQVAVKNTKDLKEAYTQQGINNLNDTMTKKLAFDSWLNSQQQYRGKPTYIDKDGIQHYEGQALYSPKPNFWGNTVVHNPTNIDWSTYQRSTGNKIDSPEELGAAYQRLLELMPGLTPDAFIKSRTLMNYNTSASSVPPSFKRGGKFKSKKPY